MMVEEFVPGRELTVSVMGDRALGVTEITTELEFYDYEAKYAPGGSQATSCRPRFLPQSAEQAMDLAVAPTSAGLPRRHPHRFPL